MESVSINICELKLTDLSQPAQTATVAVRDPFMTMRKLYWWSTSNLLNTSTLVPPMAVARMVLVTAMAITSPSPGCDSDPCLPTFWARNPNTSMSPPRAARGTEWPGMLTIRLSLNLPARGPISHAPMKAQTAPHR